MRAVFKFRLKPDPTSAPSTPTRTWRPTSVGLRMNRPLRPTLVGLRIAIAILTIGGVAVEASPQLSSRGYASGFSSPVAFVQDPADRSVQFVVEQDGTIRAV